MYPLRLAKSGSAGSFAEGWSVRTQGSRVKDSNKRFASLTLKPSLFERIFVFSEREAPLGAHALSGVS